MLPKMRFRSLSSFYQCREEESLRVPRARRNVLYWALNVVSKDFCGDVCWGFCNEVFFGMKRCTGILSVTCAKLVAIVSTFPVLWAVSFMALTSFLVSVSPGTKRQQCYCGYLVIKSLQVITVDRYLNCLL